MRALPNKPRLTYANVISTVALFVALGGASYAASGGLAPLLETIGDPFLQALGKLALAWTAPIGGDFSGALREALHSLEQLRGQAEPYWTAVAVLTWRIVFAATSFSIRATSSATGMAPTSPSTRSRTATVPAVCSFSPTTSMYGTFSNCASRIL